MRLMAFAETVKGGVYICSRVIPSFPHAKRMSETGFAYEYVRSGSL